MELNGIDSPLLPEWICATSLVALSPGNKKNKINIRPVNHKSAKWVNKNWYLKDFDVTQHIVKSTKKKVSWRVPLSD